MQTIDFYIARTVAVNTAMVALVLLSIFIFVDFISQLDDVGKGSYGMGDAAQAVLLSVPRRFTDLMPVTCLLGVSLGLGILANGSEITAMRAAGISIVRITYAVMKFAVVLILLQYFISESIAPKAEQWAQQLQSKTSQHSTTLLAQDGFWTREGDTFIKVQKVHRTLLSGLDIFQLKNRRLISITHAESAKYNDKRTWLLQNVRRSIFTPEGVYTETLESEFWNTPIDPDLLEVVSVKPQQLTMVELYQYTRFLETNGQDASRYALALWKKLAVPVVIFLMVGLAVPFVFGPMRSVAIGQRIVVSTILGIAFYVFDLTTGHLGLVYRLPAWFAALSPSMMFFAINVWLMRSVR